jgi:hypothetical protein
MAAMTSPAAANKFALEKVRSADPSALPVGLDQRLKQLIDAVLDRVRPASDKPALLFLLAYKTLNPSHNLSSIPIGWRPADKMLCAALTNERYTLHSNITAFGENMGTKGQAGGYDLFTRQRTGQVLKYITEKPHQLGPALDYIAYRFKRSYREPVTIERLPADALTFTRANKKAQRLLSAVTGGHFPQFLVASLLQALHDQWGNGFSVITHHPHGSDISDKTAGDVELYDEDDNLVDAYEVTVRPDWKNRRPDLIKKIRKFGLTQYHILCITERDPQLTDPELLDTYISQLDQDISVVDIRAFVSVTLMALTRESRVRSFEILEEYVKDPKLCGVPEYVDLLKEILEA